MQKNLQSPNESNFEHPEVVVIQLGANWIHNCDPDDNPLFKLSKALNVQLHMTSPDDDPGDDVCLYDASPGLYREGSGNRASGIDHIDSSEYICENEFSQRGPLFRVAPQDYALLMARWGWIKEHVEKNLIAESESDSLLDAFHEAVLASEHESLAFGPCSPSIMRGLNWCFDRISIDFARSIKDVSVRYYRDQDSTGLHGEGIVQGGYFQLLNHLAKEFPLDIRLRHVVNRVESIADGSVVVTCSNGDVFETAACLVTLPVAVLQTREVEFVPEPEELAQWLDPAVACPGIMNLVWLWYSDFFWPQDGTNFFGIAREDDEPPTFTTFLAPPLCDQYGQRQPILMCQVYGDFAQTIESMSDYDIAKQATAVLRRMFGTAVKDAVGCVHSAWRSDPFAQCSWTTFPSLKSEKIIETSTEIQGKYAKDELVPALSMHSCSPASTTDVFPCWAASTEGHLSGDRPSCVESDGSQTPGVYFAGEATHEAFRGTVHAAYLSGIREAEKILKERYA